MAVGVSGRHGNHAVWRVEGETGHVLAHVLIQRQSGTERIALGEISPQRFVIWTNVKVDMAKTSEVHTRSNLSCHELFLLIIS